MTGAAPVRRLAPLFSGTGRARAANRHPAAAPCAWRKPSSISQAVMALEAGGRGEVSPVKPHQSSSY